MKTTDNDSPPNELHKKQTAKSNNLSRSDFLQLSGGVAGALLLPGFSNANGKAPLETANPAASKSADYTLHISNVLAELAPDRVISTTGYNDEVSGQVIRLKEGKRTTVDIHNDTDTPEQVHWHGQFLSDTVDGASEAGTPYIPAHGHRRISFFPDPNGSRFVHSHVRCGQNLQRGQYTGQQAFVYVEPKNDPGRYDREEFLKLNPNYSRKGY
jgi:FtsP/CotA-like multicopper oxidase with cupredoxin domain